MAGSRGPVPKSDAQRRRRNKPDVPVHTVAAQVEGFASPEPDAAWHPIARDWFVSLGQSGQSAMYEPSDWAMARLGAEMMSTLCSGERPSAQMLASLLSLTSSLLATEGDRRRLRLELARGPQVDEDEEASVAALDDYRNRLGNGG